VQNYDIIFLGYPNWYADLPMPLYSFLEQNNFAGKTIILFTTHSSSGLSRTVETITRLQPQANVVSDALSIQRDNVPRSERDIVAWLRRLGS
jgi:flavodoxin